VLLADLTTALKFDNVNGFRPVISNLEYKSPVPDLYPFICEAEFVFKIELVWLTFAYNTHWIWVIFEFNKLQFTPSTFTLMTALLFENPVPVIVIFLPPTDPEFGEMLLIDGNTAYS
jgi:hypothetical protein